MEKRGMLLILSGFSGAGKGTVVKGLMKQGQFALSISATTRSPREGEVDGRDYFFISHQEFETMIREAALYEYATYCGNHYGTPREYVDKQMAQGRDVILEIEMQGALQVKKMFPEAVLIFIVPPTVTVLKERLMHRGTEEMDVIMRRLKRSSEEARSMDQYDYIVVNDQLEPCIEAIVHIVEAERQRGFRSRRLQQKFIDEFALILKGDN
ncbi:guanylate kinase [Anaerotalea alkaliphila]|uniref:Guanylate kinase n=1 Tax=Anaerotalea alkaliphila TaxID=2662126 RepID=A0A7X5HUN3_9FIRM|nr:guanylate kinase [Anaerotalea alkaliphila]NDL66895.1 guanylate kinase [Anaerotalea alkaliphila]